MKVEDLLVENRARELHDETPRGPRPDGRPPRWDYCNEAGDEKYRRQARREGRRVARFVTIPGRPGGSTSGAQWETAETPGVLTVRQVIQRCAPRTRGSILFTGALSAGDCDSRAVMPTCHDGLDGGISSSSRLDCRWAARECDGSCQDQGVRLSGVRLSAQPPCRSDRTPPFRPPARCRVRPGDGSASHG